MRKVVLPTPSHVIPSAARDLTVRIDHPQWHPHKSVSGGCESPEGDFVPLQAQIHSPVTSPFPRLKDRRISARVIFGGNLHDSICIANYVSVKTFSDSGIGRWGVEVQG